MTDLLIRRWRREDIRLLRLMVREYLRETFDTGADYPPTDLNVGTFLARGLRGARRRDPVLVALVENVPVAFSVGLGLHSDQLDFRGPVCLGFSVYVLPEHRRRGLCTRLHEEGFRVAREQGYSRVESAVYAPIAYKAALRGGCKQIGVIVGTDLEAA